MSDRSSAYIYSTVFEMIAKHVPEEKREAVAKQMWKDSFEYDFHPSDMDIDKTLTKLGLAKMGVDPDYPDEGETTLYRWPNGKWRT